MACSPMKMVLYNSPVVATAYAMPSSAGGAHEDLRNVRSRVERHPGGEGVVAQSTAESGASGAEFEQEDAVSKVLRDGLLLEIILRKLEHDVSSRHAASEVCSAWYFLDGKIRREVTVANCYSAYPPRLTERFADLKSIKLKCRPRAVEFQQLIADWGGCAREWVDEIAAKYRKLESLHLKRAVVTDADLERIGEGCGNFLRQLILDKCDGFSAAGLLSIGGRCRSLRVFSMAGSRIADLRGPWLKTLAENNPHLAVLVLPDPGPVQDMDEDDDAEEMGPENAGLTALVENCKSLRRFGLGVWKKQADCREMLAQAPALTELGTGYFTEVDEDHRGLLPDRLTILTGLYDMLDHQLPFVFPSVGTLRRLDLKYAKLSHDSQMELIKRCQNLEVLEVRPTVGDVGLFHIGRHCRHLKKLRVERLDIDMDDENEVTGQGLEAIAVGCPDLEFLVVYAAELSNDSLIALSQHCPKLNDLRLIIVQKNNERELAPVDEGILHVMQRCRSLTKLALAVRKGCLTNTGLKYIGEYGGSRLKWILLVCSGDDDVGLEHLLLKCHNLRRLELRNCPFSASAFQHAFPEVASGSQRPRLKYLWVEGEPAIAAGHVLRGLRRERLHIEVSDAVEDENIQEELFAYYSFRNLRTDCPASLQQLTSPASVKLFSGRTCADD